MGPDHTNDLGSIGAYRLLSRLGKGGMGEVFRAWDDRLKRHVAIKRIRAERSFDDSARARFRREAQAVARLGHPAIVQIYDVLDTDDSEGIVMEHVEGEDLSTLLEAGRFTLRDTLEIIAAVASGLGHAHHKGLIHRDLKAENLMVTGAAPGAGTSPVKILDFGLARALTGDVASGLGGTLTEPGAVMGTVHAMSPEQAMGQEVDHRTDLFALGTILYQMLTGTPPFRGKNWIETLNRVIHEAPEPIDHAALGIPPELAELTLALLEKKPEDRPQSADEVLSALRRLDPQLSGGFSSASGGFQALATPSREVSGGAPRVPTQITAAQIRTLVLAEFLGGGAGEQTRADLAGAGRHRRLVAELAEAHHGAPVAGGDGESRGDGSSVDAGATLLLFERPADAVGFALDLHRQVTRPGSDSNLDPADDASDDGLAARVAIHLGEVRLSQDDPESETAAVAVDGYARSTTRHLLDLASPRQTLLTRGAFDLARRASAAEGSGAGDGEAARLHWLAHGAYVFRRLDEPVQVFEVGAEDFAPLLAPEGSKSALRSVAVGDEMVLGWRPAVGLPIPRQPNWTLVERIGEGGFGEVWLARHKSEEKRVFKFCFDSARLRSLKREVTLFRLLKQTLGNRDDIARIIEWDFDESPFYLAAEYTEGGSLVTWCEESGGVEQVPTGTRLELMAQVAVALSAAHSVGVLHKDVKPDNVLVTRGADGEPHIRLTDFGIGYLTDDTQLLGRLFTIQGMTGTQSEGEGTQMYMAPELLEGKPPSVQADVYSLGVMLYQVVVGDFKRALATGWRRDIDDELLAGDIAHFVEGRPERRAESALEVAKRLRSLEQRRAEQAEKDRERREAQAARRALRRAQRRRRLATAAAGALLLTLALVSIFAFRERQARREASREAQTSQRVTELLVDLFDAADPFGATGDVLTVRELLDRGTERIQGELAGEPEVQATLLHTMGDTYKSLGLFSVAIPLVEQAAELRRRTLGPRHPLVADGLQVIGEAQCRRGDFTDGEQSLRTALEVRREIAPGSLGVGESLEALGHLCLQFRADYDGAEAALREAAAIHRRELGADDPETIEAEHRLALVMARQGQLDAAIALLHEVLAGKRDHFGRHPDVARVLVNLAHTLWWRGDPSGEPYAREAVAIVDDKLPEAHPLTAVSLQVLGGVLRSGGKLEEAEATYRRALAIRDRLGDRTFRRADAGMGLAWVLVDRGDYGEAEATIDESLAIYREVDAPPQLTTQFSKAVKGACLAQRSAAQAEEVLVEAIEDLDAGGPTGAPYRRATLGWLIDYYDQRDQPDRAALYRRRLADS